MLTSRESLRNGSDYPKCWGKHTDDQGGEMLTGCSEGWWMSHLWRLSRSGGTGLWATWYGWRCPCSVQGVWTRWPLKVPSEPICDSMSCFCRRLTDISILTILQLIRFFIKSTEADTNEHNITFNSSIVSKNTLKCLIINDISQILTCA